VFYWIVMDIIDVPVQISFVSYMMFPEAFLPDANLSCIRTRKLFVSLLRRAGLAPPDSIAVSLKETMAKKTFYG